MKKDTIENILLTLGVLLFWSAITFILYFLYGYKLKWIDYLSNCKYTLSGWVFTINASCVPQKKLPELTLVEIVEESWWNISELSWYYQAFNTSFEYYWAIPSFKKKWSPYLQENEESELLISQAIDKREKISFSIWELAQYYAKHLSYYVADKDLTNLWRCTRKNYLLAFESIDWLVMNPWNIFNANTKLGNLTWYCEWDTDISLSFYWWVCGMVSQLFRVSLLNPNININKRFSHTERFVQYYWETIWWDDAAVYEYSKQFEIENIWNSDIVFKTREEWNKTILVAISWPTDKWVNISKKNIDGRENAIHLNKSIYESNIITRQEDFYSYYSKKTYEMR